MSGFHAAVMGNTLIKLMRLILSPAVFSNIPTAYALDFQNHGNEKTKYSQEDNEKIKLVTFHKDPAHPNFTSKI